MRKSDVEGFETFYKDVRTGLLLQTYALTGDLHASEKAVRDAMVVGWHHWRKVSRLDDREDYVRPLAWRRALRRSQARWWSRMKGLDPDVASVLDALAKLPVTQRRVLLLSHLTALPLEGIAREVGVSRPIAERDLQTATAQLTTALSIEAHSIRPALDLLRPQVEDVRWPRPSIITRAGSARRRSHTAFGAAVAVAALVVSGSVVTDAAGVRPSLEDKGVLEGVQPEAPETQRPEPQVEQLTPESLLTPDQVGLALEGRWTQGQTSGNTQGDGLAFTCQGSRYADPDGLAALLRTFRQEGAEQPLTLGQYVEVSADETAGKETYRTTAQWYAGCTAPRVQLISTHQVKDVGDNAMIFVLRSWADPTSAQVVGVARTGTVTTTTSLTAPGEGTPPLEASAALLEAAVDDLCGLPGGATCAGEGRLKPVPPMATGPEPPMLSEVDLPPVTKVALPWAGTDPAPAQTNLAATRCEEADFATFSRNTTRTFLIPDAGLPPEFGLTQTVAALPVKQARAFVGRVRDRMSTCSDRDFGTDVFKIEVIPADGVVMGGEPFVALAMRAQDRLVRLGRPKA